MIQMRSFVAAAACVAAFACVASAQQTLLPSQTISLPSSSVGTVANEVGIPRVATVPGGLWMVVGMPYGDPSNVQDAGRVALVKFAANGTSTQSDVLAPSPVANERFGMGTGTDGNVLVVVAGGTGNVYLYRRSGATFVHERTFAAAVTPNWGNYQCEVLGNKVIVPDPLASSAAGRFLVYQYSGTTWSLAQTVTAPTPIAGRSFAGGLYVTTSTLVATEYTSSAAGCIGRSFAFQTANLGAAPVQLPDPTGTSGCSLFGSGASGTDSVAAIRARDDSANGSASGSIFIFDKSGSTWTQSLRSGPTTNVANRKWGAPSVFGNRVLATCEGTYTPSSVFVKSAGAWSLSKILTLPSSQTTGVTRWGTIYRDTAFVPVVNSFLATVNVFPLTDCNANGLGDETDVAAGFTSDTNNDSIPDSCQCGTIPSLPACNAVNVPGTYPTIQAAIDATPAGTGRIINVAAGTYGGPINFNGKNVVVRGAGPGATIIAGISGQTSAVVNMVGEPATAALEQVTVRDGYTGTPFPNTPSALCGGGIFGNGTSASIRDCIVEANGAGYGGGIYLLSCTSTIERCTVRNNSATSGGGGVQFYGGRNRVIDTLIEGNRCTSVGAGIALGGVQELTRVVIRNNSATLGSGGIWWTSVGQSPNSPAMLTVTDCVVTGNSVAAGADGGITVLSDSVTPWISLQGTQVCGNTPRPNVNGRWINLGGNTICDCIGDLTADGQVNGADLGSMLSAWGPCGVTCAGDLNQDGIVNGLDLGLLLANWGTCAP